MNDSKICSTGGATTDFDLGKLRLSQNFAEAVPCIKASTTIPVRKPNKQDFIRVHPNPEMRLEAAVIDAQSDGQVYITTGRLAPDLGGIAVGKVLYPAITRQGDLFLWAIRLPTSEGKLDNYNRSALEIVPLAREKWVSVRANLYAGLYDCFTATGQLPEPEWPELPLEEWIRLGFKERVIDSKDHLILRQLRGEI